MSRPADRAQHADHPDPFAPADRRAPADYAVVVPTIGRDSLADCLGALAAATGPPPREIVVVDDRPATAGWLSGSAQRPLDHALTVLGDLREHTRVLHSGGRGPAAARNTGLRAVSAPWVVFLDDDVQVGPHWCDELARDLARAPADTAGVQAVLQVPLPDDRRATDAERGTAGLAHALWITADMAYRADVLKQTGGFDERFPRAFREDADLALRVLDTGRQIRRGRRTTRHPVRPADRWASLRAQRGNRDDALMLRLHGPDWWQRAAAPRGRIHLHLAVTALASAAAVLAAAGRRNAALAAAAGWAVGTAEFAWARIAPGPRTADEITTMLATSVLIPPVASWHWLYGLCRHRRAGRRTVGEGGEGG